MAVPDLSPAAIAARLAAAPANGSPYTYQDYLNAGNAPGANQGQGESNFATAILTGNPQYQQLLQQAKAGNVQAQQALPALASQLVQQSGLDPSKVQFNFGDPSSSTYGAGKDMNTGFDTPLATSIVLGGLAAGGGFDGLFGGGSSASAATSAGATGTSGATSAFPAVNSLSAAGTTAMGGTAAGAGSLPSIAASAGAAGGGGINWGSLLGPALQTGGSLVNGIMQQGNTAAQLKNQQLQQALGATQTNPYTQLQDTQRQQLANLLVNNYQPMTYTPPTQSGGANPTMTQAGQFNGGIGQALTQLPSISSSFGQPAMNAAASNFNQVASNNPFYTNQLTGVPGFNFSTNANSGQSSGLGTNPAQGATGKPSPASINTGTQVGQAALPFGSIPGYSSGATTPSALQSLSKSLTQQPQQQQSILPFGNMGV